MPHFFIPLRKVLNSIKNLDIDSIAYEIANTNTFQTLVISLNTEGTPTSQLYEKGEDSRGRSLKEIAGNPNTDSGYSPFTIREKQSKGQRTDHITLKDTGDFYLSFTVRPFKGGFSIDADPIKDEDDLFKVWGEDVVGLNVENLGIITEYYRNAILQEVNRKIRA